MEPVTHCLTGACLSRAGFNRKTPLATITMILAAEAPDIDFAAYAKGSVTGFACHRGVTHTIWGIPLVAALVIAVVFTVHRFWPRRSPRGSPRQENGQTAPAGPRPRWGLLYLFACIAGYSHLLLDYTNSYGVRPLWPWWPKWYSWDIVFIVEPLLLVFLIGGLTLPGLFALGSRESGTGQQAPRGRLGAIMALVLMAALWTLRDHEHRQAVQALAAMQYRAGAPVRISAFPYMVNPFFWYGLAETGKSYTAMQLDLSSPAANPQERARIYLKPEPTPASQAASSTRVGQVYLDWAQYPLVETERPAGNEPGYLVRFRDLRFMYPDSRHAVLAAYVLLSPTLQVEQSGFGWRGQLSTGLANAMPLADEKR
jgi:inner membrane protein